MFLLAERAIHFKWNNPRSPSCHRNYPTDPGQRSVWISLHWIRRIITVDDYSNFFEIRAVSDTRSSSVITSLKWQFARDGISSIVGYDNGPQFSPSDFKMFSKEWDFEHITSSPHYARSDGKIEKAVNTAKRILKKAKFNHKDPYLALLDWRNTPTEGLDSSPVQKLMGRGPGLSSQLQQE